MALLMRPRVAGKPSQLTINDVELRRDATGRFMERVRKTNKPAVFVSSPSSRRARRQQAKVSRLRRTLSLSAVLEALSSYRLANSDDDCEVPLVSRVATDPYRRRRSSAIASRVLDGEETWKEEEEEEKEEQAAAASAAFAAVAAAATGGPGCIGGESRGRSERRLSFQESPPSSDEESDSGSDEEVGSASVSSRQSGPGLEPLKEGVQRRVTEQMLVAMLKMNHSKTKVRLLADGSPTRSRMRTNALGRDFTTLYSNTVGILEACMTTRPPRRQHTIEPAELSGLYSSSPESSPIRRRAGTDCTFFRASG